MKTPTAKPPPFGLWTTKEIRVLRRHARDGVEVIAEKIGRSQKSVQRMAERQRVSLRRRGSRRGRVLGQPQEQSFKRDEILNGLRTAIIDEKIDPADLLRLANEMARAVAPLCPFCAQAPQDPKTGVCKPCYVEKTTEAYVVKTRELIEVRRMENERQRRRRALKEPEQ